MEQQLCVFTKKPAEYLIGVANYNSRRATIVGPVCAEKVEDGITNILTQAFGTTKWPTVHSLDGKLLYHSYDADKDGIAAVGGWRRYLENPPGIEPKLSDYQQKLLDLLSKKKGGQSLSVSEISWRMKTSKLAAYQIGKALERKGLAISSRSGDDQWAVLVFFAK